MTTRLEDLKPEALVQGLVRREAVRVVTAEMLGEAACKVVYRSQDGALGESSCCAEIWPQSSVQSDSGCCGMF